MPMEFIDNSIKVIGALDEAKIQWLYEMSSAIEAHAQRNCVMEDKVGDALRGSYEARVNVGAGEAQIGSPMEAVYWEEFGTGSYAEKGKGRKGWWVYVKDGTEHAPGGGKTYPSREEAQEAADFLRSQGLDAYATNGRPPYHTLQNAFEEYKPKAEAILANIIQERLGE